MGSEMCIRDRPEEEDSSEATEEPVEADESNTESDEAEEASVEPEEEDSSEATEEPVEADESNTESDEAEDCLLYTSSSIGAIWLATFMPFPSRKDKISV